MRKETHTPKEKRMASHIEKSEKDSGKSAKRSKEVAWATVNKRKKTKGKKTATRH